MPTDPGVTPLQLVRHQVNVTVEDQVAVTKVVQTFHNHTSQQLEADYVFPVPKGASVKKFVMWVDGKEVPGELVQAEQARQVYTDVVRRMKDPGLLEYLGNNLLRVRVFPVPANGDQKLAISFTSIASSDAGLVEYVYPLKADANTAKTLAQFSFDATIKAQHPIQNIYSPSHKVTVERVSDRHARVHFQCGQTRLDKDLQLYYTTANRDVGLTTLMHRPQSGSDGHFMMLISPRAELSHTQQVPRDMVFVLDTSGSMQGQRIDQAKKALQFCLRNLGPKDRFGILHFATSVTKYRDNLTSATPKNLNDARQWVEELQANGGTNINDALLAALDMRSQDPHRCFTMVFFTDGQANVGESNTEAIVKNVMGRNTTSTRIFTFGVGDDVNAVLLDQLAEKTRSVSTYVREHEDIEAKVSGLYSKISNPVLTNLKLTVKGQPWGPPKGGSSPYVKKMWQASVSEIYPPQLPDLFHGSQLVVLGRFKGTGSATITLSGTVDGDSKEFVYETRFPGQTGKDKAFVEDLWARRKVGYLLDQIRVNGETTELKDEVVALAKKHGITTPYTSYLVLPDAAPGVALNRPLPAAPPTKTNTLRFISGPTAAAPSGGTYQNYNIHGQGTIDLSNTTNGSSMIAPGFNINSTGSLPSSAPPALPGGRIQFAPVQVAPQMTWAVPNKPLATGGIAAVDFGTPTTGIPAGVGGLGFQGYAQAGRAGVDQSVQLNELRTQSQVTAATVRQVAGRSCREVNGVWTDEGFKTEMKRVTVKALSAAYFRMLERHPELAEVFQLGNRVLWVTPSGKALVIDPGEGCETLSDGEIDRLFR